MVTVLSTGGAGATSTAVALARALGRRGGAVLVDLTRHCDVAHHLGLDPTGPGLRELLDGARPAPATPVGHGLQVVTGLRHPADWTAASDR